MTQLRSLNLEHVSPPVAGQNEISRPEKSLAPLRKWFWTRKPDAGFFLEKFPATLLQAKVFDEWLETRDERLDAVLLMPDASPALAEHYHMQGLALEASSLAAV